MFARGVKVPAGLPGADGSGFPWPLFLPSPSPAFSAAKQGTRMPEKVLVVDDEADARVPLVMLLRREGFEVRDASDGESALAECASFRPDLILLDILMPGMNGFEVCRRIKATPETRLTPVVLITGLSGTEERIKGINAGADDFLSKPIDFNELLARTRSLLRLKQFTDELEHAESVLFTLAHAIEARDPYTHGHCERLAEMSTRLATNLGLSEEHIKALRRAGFVHDIGKVAVPDAILLKPKPLSEEETRVMRKHPVVGERAGDEHPVARADERLRHERGEQPEVCAGDGPRRRTVEAAPEDGQLRERVALLVGEQPPRLVERGPEAAMPLGHVTHRGGQEVDVPLDLVGDVTGLGVLVGELRVVAQPGDGDAV